MADSLAGYEDGERLAVVLLAARFFSQWLHHTAVTGMTSEQSIGTTSQSSVGGGIGTGGVS